MAEDRVRGDMLHYYVNSTYIRGIKSEFDMKEGHPGPTVCGKQKVAIALLKAIER